MNEYIIPTKYQNIGCGISVKVAGLEQNQDNYKYIGVSIDGNAFIETNINQDNADTSDIISFDNLEEDKYYMLHCKIIYSDNSENNISAKVPSSIGVATVVLSRAMAEQRYKGGGLVKEVSPKEVV